ncbi:flagellar hook-length control protein FliK [Limnobacter humi]|uniref:Flagellar hook-length control protein FliK n=1 Tax=Limnobacter humi TaxID=1778671 RepID=A0ABT1WJQ9_9BURK|nr:flagellar hook-length control protein FliK [Limnobacter humi]MCQ8897760.1 flagellar hook-length control protein FliK [Limnobacter humi]
MTTGTSSVNNTMKVQNTAAKSTAKTTVDPSAVDFSSLFSSAKLNRFESQMRDALGNDTLSTETQRSNQEKRSKAPATPDPQAMVWAQHSWMAAQQRPVSPATPVSEQTRSVDSATKANLDNRQSQATAAHPADDTPSDSNNSATAPATTANEADSAASNATVLTPQKNATADATPVNTTVDKVGSAPLNIAALPTETKPSVQASATAEGLPLVANNASAQAQPTTSALNEPGTRQGLRHENGSAELTLPVSMSSELSQGRQTADARSAASAMDPTALARLPIQAAVAAQTQAVSAQTQDLPLDELSIKAGDSKLTTTNLNPALGSLPGQSAVARGTAPAVGIRTPVSQPGFAKELGQTINWALGKQLSTVELRVNPESFGPMNLKIVQKGQELHITIRTQDESSANLMAQAVSGLKETMAQNGLQLNQVTVQHSQGFNLGQSAGDSNSAQTAQQGQQGQQSPGRRSGNPADGEGLSNDTQQTNASRGNAAPGGLDLFA